MYGKPQTWNIKEKRERRKIDMDSKWNFDKRAQNTKKKQSNREEIEIGSEWKFGTEANQRIKKDNLKLKQIDEQL